MNQPRELLEDAEEVRNDPPSGQVDVVDAARHAITRFPFTILALTVLGGVAGLFVALSVPNQYTSTAQLLLRLGAREQLTPEAAIDSESQVRGAGIQITDQVLMWQDPALAERVASAVGPARLLARYDPTHGDDEATPAAIRKLHALQAWIMDRVHGDALDLSGVPTAARTNAAASVVASRILLIPTRNSSTIAISFTSHDPELSRDVVKAYIEVIQKRHQEIFQTVPQLEFVRQKSQEAEQQASAAISALRARQIDDGVYDVAEMITMNSQRLDALRNERESDQVNQRTLERQLALLEQEYSARKSKLALAEGESTLASQEPAPPASEVATPPDPTQSFRFTVLRDELRQVVQQLESMSEQYREDSPVVASDMARLRSRRESIELELDAMEAERQRLESGRVAAQAPITLTPTPGTAIDPILLQLDVQKLTLQQEQLALEERMHGRASLIALHEARHTELLAMEPIQAGLANEVDAAQRRVAELAEVRTRLETLAEISADERMGSLVVTQSATLPQGKDGPARGKLLAAAVVGGTLLGVALAVLRQLLDSRLRYPKNVERALGIPVLGVVPEERRWRLDSKKFKRLERKSVP